jgi:hypothetical protein
MIRVYTFTFTTPDGMDVAQAGQLITKQLDRMAAQSESLVKAQVHAEPPELVLRMWFQGADRWRIQQRIKYPLVAAIRKGGLSMEQLKSTQIDIPANGRDKPTPRVPPPARWAPVDW